MATYAFDVQYYQQYAVNTVAGSYLRLDIYEYLGHPVRLIFHAGPGAPTFFGSIEGNGPEQYEFICVNNLPQWHAAHIEMLRHPGVKRVSIEADTSIPAQGPFSIRISSFIMTTDILLSGFPPVQVQEESLDILSVMPEYLRKIIKLERGKQ
jgi:hypothetical protein